MIGILKLTAGSFLSSLLDHSSKGRRDALWQCGSAKIRRSSVRRISMKKKSEGDDAKGRGSQKSEGDAELCGRPRSNSGMSASQVSRRRALLQLSESTHLQIFRRDGHRLELTKRGIAGVALLSSAAYYLLRLVLRDRLGRYAWYKVLQTKSDRSQLFESYILSIVNASIICIYSGYKMICSEEGSTRGATRMLATALGYFCHDMVMMRNQFQNDLLVLFHHVFGISIVVAVMGGPSWPDDGVKRFIPPIGTIELSTVFLSGMWLVRETGNGHTGIFKVMLGLFGTSFFATRIVLLNYYLAKMWNDLDFKKLGIARYMLLALSVLNAYWFKKIVGMATKSAA